MTTSHPTRLPSLFLPQLLTIMRAQSSFFSQGYDLFKVYDPFISELTNTAEALKKESCVEMDKMSKRHSLVVTQHLQCMQFLFGLSEVMFSDSILTDITPQDESPDEPLFPMDNPAALVLCMSGKSLGVVWMRYQ
ncbi:hypothetical protein EMCRGX_G016480 [Ephydatia muelleri]